MNDIFYNIKDKNRASGCPMAEKSIHPIAWRGDIIYDVKKLWKLTKGIKPQLILVSQLEWVLNEKLWSNREGLDKDDPTPERDISAMQVLNNPNLSKFHVEAIRNADLSYAILLIKLKNHKLDVIDGIHRLAKVYIQGGTFIYAKIVPDNILTKAEIEKK